MRPPLIAVLGDPALLASRAVALVGGRNASANGQRMAENLAAELARSLVVVSGLARGIDAAAHTGALQTGRTIAAVAGGLDMPYPPEHADLQRRIAEVGRRGHRGAPRHRTPGAPLPAPQPDHRRPRPRRRGGGGGAALRQPDHRPARPGGRPRAVRRAGSPLDPRSRGANDLIRQGAHLTETAQDVLDNLPDHPSREGLARDPAVRSRRHRQASPNRRRTWQEPAESAADLAKARRQVIDLLGTSPTAVDDVVRRCQFSAAAVMAVLLELELAGRIETLPGSRVALLPETGF